MEYYIRIDGGIGRCIASTGAVREFAKDKKVYVVTSYDFVFDGLENIERTLLIGTKGSEERILTGIYSEPEPYNDYSYYLEEKHLSQVFNKLLNGKDEYIAPVVNLSENELNDGKSIVEQQRKATGKGIVLVQPWSSSGGVPTAPDKVNFDESYRSMTLKNFNELCDKLLAKGYMPFIIRNANQIGHDKSLTFTNPVNPRNIMAMIPYVDGIICVDSFLHHASASLGSPVPTVVLWSGTNEKNLGYEGQINLREHKSINEPNRIPHDHSYYLTKNKGCNVFTDETLDKAVASMKVYEPIKCGGCHER